MITSPNEKDLIDIYELLNSEFHISEISNNPFLKYLIYKEENKLVGFINYSILYERAELNYIYVDKNFRREGIANKLMEYMFIELRKEKVLSITLEVKKSNVSAINLYKKWKFEPVSIRKNYYGNEDGILMFKEVGD